MTSCSRVDVVQLMRSTSVQRGRAVSPNSFHSSTEVPAQQRFAVYGLHLPCTVRVLFRHSGRSPFDFEDHRAFFVRAGGFPLEGIVVNETM